MWLRNLIIGDGAPLRVIQDSIEILGYVLFRLNFIVLLGGWLLVIFHKPETLQGWNNSLYHTYTGRQPRSR